jgi:uncharacterized protein YegP (UPF0339 family)
VSDDLRWEVYLDRDGAWRWRVLDANGSVTQLSFDGFESRRECESDALRVHGRQLSGETESQADTRSKRWNLLDMLDLDLERELALDRVEPARRERVLAEVTEALDLRMDRKLAALLSDAQLEELERLSENASDIRDYLEKQIPLLTAVTRQVVAEFKLDLETWEDWRARTRNS